jgi:hypothetical protein
MEPIIRSYLAERIIEDISEGNFPSNELAEELYKFPLIDDLRNRVSIKHLNSIISIIDEKNTSLCKLGVGLLAKLMKYKKAYHLAVKLWEHNKYSMEIKIAIQFRLLESHHLDQLLLNDLVDFTFDNWEEWLKIENNWIGDEILIVCEQRINEVIDQKKWIYICVAAAHKNKDEALKFIQSHAKRNKLVQAISVRTIKKLTENIM